MLLSLALAVVLGIELAHRQRLWWTGVHTEWNGPGRVRFLSVFNGAGYVVRPHRNVCIRGFTIYLRTHKSRERPMRGTPVRLVRITRKTNEAIC